MITTRDLPFPAVVTAPDGRFWPLARLLVEGGDLVVFEHAQGRVQVAARVQIADASVPGRRVQGETPTWTVAEPEVGLWRITRGTGCGCGSPLKRANVQAILARDGDTD